jgi:hypothetical protein
MNSKMLTQVTDQKAIRLLHEFEELHLIMMLKENLASVKTKPSDKYRGIISKEKGQDLNEHTNLSLV